MKTNLFIFIPLLMMGCSLHTLEQHNPHTKINVIIDVALSAEESVSNAVKELQPDLCLAEKIGNVVRPDIEKAFKKQGYVMNKVYLTSGVLLAREENSKYQGCLREQDIGSMSMLQTIYQTVRDFPNFYFNASGKKRFIRQHLQAWQELHPELDKKSRLAMVTVHLKLTSDSTVEASMKTTASLMAMLLAGDGPPTIYTPGETWVVDLGAILANPSSGGVFYSDFDSFKQRYVSEKNRLSEFLSRSIRLFFDKINAVDRQDK
ncbi:MAG: hypothetical protein JKY19_00245 [Alcanivoracaceae bacterium]|nr:hypothetical protein [Alcanivoracaceae bacterium]